MLLVVLLVLAACGDDDDASRRGDPEVYRRIESLSNCAELQQEFDTAMDNAEAREPGDDLRAVSIDYAEAADDRMKEIGCYADD